MPTAPAIPLPRQLPPLRIPRTPKGTPTVLIPSANDHFDLSDAIIIQNLPANNPQYGGQPVPEGQLFRRGKDPATGRCTTTTPNTQGNRKLKSRVVIAQEVQRMMLYAFRVGHRVGYGVGKRANDNFPFATKRAMSFECQELEFYNRQFDTMIKRAMLSQDPSFPREKSKTGVTRKGRRRKGPG